MATYIPNPNAAQSTEEEEDHLVRSTKKIKSSIPLSNTEMETEVEMLSEKGDEGHSEPCLIPPRNLPPKSFKDALVTVRQSDYTFDSSVEILSSDEEDDDQEGPSSIVHSTSEHMGLPRVTLPKKLLQKIRKPWENALIIRLLGKTIGYRMLCTRVKNIWGLQGGPWVIMDHYLTVRRWEPNFKPSEAFETTTAVWVRFPELPIEYYQDKVLFAIAKTIGKPLKIDWTTTMATRGKFARICVEMDLTQPLKPKFVLENKCYNIEYESLRSFCFLYGRIDHRKKACRFRLPSSPPDDVHIVVTSTKNSSTPTNVSNGNLQSMDTTEETFGPWMLVTKHGHRPIQPRKAQESTGPTSKPNKFKYLDEGQDRQGDHSRGRKTNRTGTEKA
ncbi:hypothetical protein ACSBR2_039852 [Camellia fascicularis]